MSKDIGILYQPEMVAALLADLKKQTRRVAGKLKGIGAITNLREVSPGTWTFKDRHQLEHSLTTAQLLELCPYGAPGSLLWVREAHYLHGIWMVVKDANGVRRWVFKPNVDMGVSFDRPNGLITGRSDTVPGWYKRNSLFMPRWASRLDLQVKEVRLERAQDISEADAYAEGVQPVAYGADAYRRGFAQIWEKINGVQSWTDNPVVWVIEFDVETRKE